MERGREGEEGGRNKEIKYFSSLEKERGRKKLLYMLFDFYRESLVHY